MRISDGSSDVCSSDLRRRQCRRDGANREYRLLHAPDIAGEAAMADQTASLAPTPTEDDLVRRFADFETLGEALDYAARGRRGLNFHDARGTLRRAYPFSELRADAIGMAHRLIAAGIRPGDRIALIAETCPEFAASFFGAIYAGAWPVPLPLPTSFGAIGRAHV